MSTSKLKLSICNNTLFCTWQVCFGSAEQNINPPVGFLAS